MGRPIRVASNPRWRDNMANPNQELLQSRRRLLGVAVVGAAGAGVLVACGGDADNTSTGTPSDSASPAPSDQPTGSQSSSPSQNSGGTTLAKLDDVPVGGAISVDGPGGQKLIVSQPKAGEAVVFSAKCTHQGCTVNPVGNRLNCPCHGSVFEASTGDVVSGPAPSPLEKVAAKVESGNIVTA